MKKVIGAPYVFSGTDVSLLMKMWEDESVKDIIKTINENYLFWDKVQHYRPTETYTVKEIWQAAKLKRLIGKTNELKIGKYKFSFGLTNRIQDQLHQFDMNIGGNLSTISLIPDSEKNIYLVSSIMEEAIASSQIEGASTTRRVAKEMLQKGRPPRTKSEQMILNNYKTIQHILKIKDEKLTIEKLKEIHLLVTDKTMDDPEEAGDFRKDDEIKVYDRSTGEIVHSPPPREELENLMEEFCSFFNEIQEDQFIHPIIKGCIIHFLLGFIHPFADGNGRTARALFYWYLLSQNYWLTEYLSISRTILKSPIQYARAFLYTEIDDHDLTYFINYNLRVMKIAFDDLKLYLTRKIQEKKKLIQFQKIKGLNERQALILHWIDEEGALVLTVKEIENRFLVSNQTARTDLLKLTNLKFLDIANLDNKTQGFYKSEFFDILIKDLIGGKPKEPTFTQKPISSPSKPTQNVNEGVKNGKQLNLPLD